MNYWEAWSESMLRDLLTGAPVFKPFLQFSFTVPDMLWARLPLEHSVARGAGDCWPVRLVCVIFNNGS